MEVTMYTSVVDSPLSEACSWGCTRCWWRWRPFWWCTRLRQRRRQCYRTWTYSGVLMLAFGDRVGVGKSGDILVLTLVYLYLLLEVGLLSTEAGTASSGVLVLTVGLQSITIYLHDKSRARQHILETVWKWGMFGLIQLLELHCKCTGSDRRSTPIVMIISLPNTVDSQ